MPTRRQLHRMREAEFEFARSQRELKKDDKSEPILLGWMSYDFENQTETFTPNPDLNKEDNKEETT